MRIVFRGDTGFCSQRMLGGGGSMGVGYIVGVAKNKRLGTLSRELMARPDSG